MSKKGGYVIVDLKGQTITAGTPFTLDGVTARLDRAKTKACLLSGFAIGDEEKRDVFVDLQKTEDGYIALFGQYTLTIEDDEVTITDGGVLLDNIVDSQGNKRFIEGDITEGFEDGITCTYGKWSLSGTHLMIVVAGTIDAGTYSHGAGVGRITLPDYIFNKVFVIVPNKTRVSWGNSVASYEDLSTVSILPVLEKQASNLRIFLNNGVTTTGTGYFRIQFDLLIDSAE